MRRTFTILDLYCCEGGAGSGYAQAGFHVVGVDAAPQPRYPGPSLVADVTALDPRWVALFDAVHASPPCQFATALNNDKTKHLNLIPATRALLEAAGVPYVIENVAEAREHLRDPVMICGTAFGLGAQGFELQRHRLFESNVPGLLGAPCAHSGKPVIGIYGGHARNRSKRHGGRGTRDVWQGGHRAAAVEAMGMPWATLNGMSEAIPPAYTKHIGLQLRAHLEGRARGL